MYDGYIFLERYSMSNAFYYVYLPSSNNFYLANQIIVTIHTIHYFNASIVRQLSITDKT